MAQALSNLPIGAKIKFGKFSVNGEAAQSVIWLVVAKNHSCVPAYPSNSVTLLTEKVVDIRAFDAQEPNSTDSLRKTAGNNRYSVSNLDQWLNKKDVQWYVAGHSYDQSPTSEYTGNYGTGYNNRPGFLNAFSTEEINAILTTTIRTSLSHVDGSGTEDFSRKIFVPSSSELGYSNLGSTGDTIWNYFSNNSKLCPLTAQAYTYSLCNEKVEAGKNCYYWIRTINTSNGYSTYTTSSSGETSVSSWSAYNGKVGVRPALNLSNTILVSDSTDTDGCYSIVWNSAPSAPTVLNVPTTIYGGKSNAISWNSANDIDGDTVTYTLECSVNGGAYSVLYNGVATAYAHLVPFGTTSVQYRVKATDPSNASSAYITSTSRTVVNNNAPVIDGADANLGVKSEGFTGTYKVTDVNNNSVTVTESIDGVQIRSLVVTLGATNTYGITGNTWLALPNGSHTLTIRATDGIDSSVRTYTFTKLVDSFTIRNSTPWASTSMPTRIMLVVTRNLPSGATFKVEVCNNGNDTTPTWEDATDAVRSGLVHVFSNVVKTSGQWGVVVRVTVNRNGATGACYVSAIGGNFE